MRNIWLIQEFQTIEYKDSVPLDVQELQPRLLFINLELVSIYLLISLYPVVPNPYNLFSEIPKLAKYFSVIDLKDAFYSLPLVEKSQYIIAFEDLTQPASKLT